MSVIGFDADMISLFSFFDEYNVADVDEVCLDKDVEILDRDGDERGSTFQCDRSLMCISFYVLSKHGRYRLRIFASAGRWGFALM